MKPELLTAEIRIRFTTSLRNGPMDYSQEIEGRGLEDLLIGCIHIQTLQRSLVMLMLMRLKRQVVSI